MKSLLILLLPVSVVCAADLNVTISGDAKEKADLETLSPKPTIPNADEMTFSLDGGKSAVEDEVVPLPVSAAALESPLSNYQAPVFPLIPESPFVVQPSPSENDPALSHLRPFGPQQRQSPLITEWEFSIIDQNNNELTHMNGTGFPKETFIWDGTKDGQLVVKPDESYFPYVVLKSSTGLTLRIPGEAERYLTFARHDGEDEIILFGDRLYDHDKADFSEEGELYLRDLKHRFSLMDPRQPFQVTITCPSDASNLANARQTLWLSFLEKTFERKMDSQQVVVQIGSTQQFLTEVVLKNFKDADHPIMTGKARDLRPGSEDMESWIQIKDTGKSVVVEMRHDRLFRAGSAYLRDEALPLILKSLKEVKAINQGKKLEERRTVLLRSYMEQPRNLSRGKTFEEDPQLAALRTKVLFMLFAEENYLR